LKDGRPLDTASGREPARPDIRTPSCQRWPSWCSHLGPWMSAESWRHRFLLVGGPIPGVIATPKGGPTQPLPCQPRCYSPYRSLRRYFRRYSSVRAAVRGDRDHQRGRSQLLCGNHRIARRVDYRDGGAEHIRHI